MPQIGTNSPHEQDDIQLKPHEVYPSWIIIGVVSLVLSIALLISTILMLSTIHGKDCPALIALPAIFLVLSFVIMAFGLFSLFRKAKQRSEEKESRGSCIGRYIFFVLMLIGYGICIFVIVLASAFYAMKRNQAMLDLDYKKASALSASVAITRDDNGIPHVTAATLHDAMFAQGFVIAQDRLFQIELSRLVTYGRTAEFLGSAALDLDRATRSINLKAAATLMYDRLTTEEYALLEKYVAGINYYLDKDGAMPPEFMFMSTTLFTYHVPDHFTVMDVCAVGVLLMFRINTNRGAESLRWELFAEGGMSYDQINDLMYDPVADNTESILTASELGITAADAAAARAREDASKAMERALYEDVMWRFRENETVATSASSSSRAFATQEEAGGKKGEKTRGKPSYTNWWLGVDIDLFGARHTDDVGSQGWFVRKAGNLSTYGGGDPHLVADIPSVWHQIHLRIGGKNYIGASVPGIPGIVYGSTEDIAWSITISFGDLQDHYLMVPDPSNLDTHYMYNGSSVAYTVRREVVKVKGGSDHVMEVQESILGPVVGSHLDMTKKHKIVFNSTGNLLLGRVSPMLDLWRAENVTAAVTAIRELAAPALSITIGDAYGGLAYTCTGTHPIRRQGHTGRWPILGNGTYQYLGYVSRNQHPTKIDTNTAVNGRVSSANNRIYPDGFKYSLGFDYINDYRFRRLNSLLDTALATGSEDVLSLDFHRKVQNDERCNWWVRDMRPALVALGSTWTSKLDAIGLAKWNTILQWNNESSLGASEPGVVMQFVVELNTLPKVGLQQLDWEAWTTRQLFGQRLISAPSAWMLSLCKGAGDYATCIDYAAAVWNKVAARSDRKWGQNINRLHARHIVFGETFLACVFNIEVDKPGDWSALSYSSAPGAQIDTGELFVTATSSMRQLSGFGENYTLFSLPGGASGHTFSAYFDNLAPMMKGDEYAVIKKGSLSDVEHGQILSP